jgi:hypothetical protein
MAIHFPPSPPPPEFAESQPQQPHESRLSESPVVSFSRFITPPPSPSPPPQFDHLKTSGCGLLLVNSHKERRNLTTMAAETLSRRLALPGGARDDEQTPLLPGAAVVDGGLDRNGAGVVAIAAGDGAADGNAEERVVGGGGAGTFTRNLGAVEAFAIVVSIVIGSGVFTSPGSIDTNVPSPGVALLVWLVGGVLAWTGASTMAELGTAIPGEGIIAKVWA